MRPPRPSRPTFSFASKFLAAFALVLCGNAAVAQNIGINTDGSAPVASAMLDIKATDRGLLIPRLTTTQRLGILTPAQGLVVYDITSNSFWYYNGTAWVEIGVAANAWTPNGNSGTTPGTNFVGTTDVKDLVIKTGGIAPANERMRILSTGKVGIGVSPTLAQLEVSSGSSDAVTGYGTHVGGTLGRETSFQVGSDPLNILLGAGLYTTSSTANYASLYAQSTGSATVAAAIDFSNVWIAHYSLLQHSSTLFDPPPASYAQLTVSANRTGNHLESAFRAFSDRGTVAGNPGTTVGVLSTGIAQNQDAIGVWGSAFTNSGPTTPALRRAGGYFESYNYAAGIATQAYAYVGVNLAGTTRKITGTAGVSEIVPTQNHGRIMLTCPESPEYWYQDYGTVQLVNGHAHVNLDPILADIIVVTEDYPVRVFCTPVDMTNFNGVAQVNRTATGFDLVELNGGTNSGTLDYQIIAKPKTGYGEGRFPQGAGPAWLKTDEEPASAKAANQPDPSKIFNWPADFQVYGYDVDKMTPVGAIVPAGPHYGKFKVADGVFMDHMPVKRPSK